jgi:aspartate/methionine/tyrosine aminotransferase
VALGDLLSRGACVRQQIRERIDANLATLKRLVMTTPAVSLPKLEAGWSAVVQVPRYRSEEALVLDLLTQDRVLVHPGFFFDFAEEAYLVVSLLPPPNQFASGMARVLARAAHPGPLS